MVNANKLVKGDIVEGVKFDSFDLEPTQYIFLSREPTYVKLRDRKKGWIISQGLRYFEDNFSRVYEWSPWRVDKMFLSCEYRTNRKEIQYRGKGVKVEVTCHEDDEFNLGAGLDIARTRWLKKKNEEDNKKKVNAQNIQGKVYGDFKADKLHSFDSAGNPIWLLHSTNNEEKRYATVWELENGLMDTESTYTKSVNNYKTIVIDFMQKKREEEEKSEKEKLNKLTPVQDDDFTSTSVVQYQETTDDLLSVPVYYYIAHCIPADLTFGGETAKRIDALMGIRASLQEICYLDPVYIGDCILVRNVYSLIASPKKYTHADINDLIDCIYNLAEDCIMNDVKYLAMPHIGCGHNRLDWNKIKPVIIEAFDVTWNRLKEDYQYDYGPDAEYHINIRFCDNSNTQTN